MQPNSYNKRREDIRSRISSTENAYRQCVVLECNGTTTAHERNGLNRHYCRRHVEHYRRHGSYSKPSYSAAELNPYRKTAHEWLSAHSALPAVQEAVDRVRTLYWRGGRPIEAFRLAGRPPKERAKVVWARLYQHKVEPLQVLAVNLAVSMRHSQDMQPERRVQFRRVQVAKVLHRLAGGSHKRWEHELDGQVEVTHLHKYPASRGQVLRHVGRVAAWATAPLDEQLSSLLGIHQARTKGHSQRLATMRQRQST